MEEKNGKAAENPHAGHRARLRKTYMEAPEGMQEHQLLELLLMFALPRRDVNPLAHALLKRYGTIGGVLSADVHELKNVRGVGESVAVLLSLAGRLGGASNTYGREGRKLNNPYEATEFCRELFRNERYEAIYAVSLDKRRRVLHCDRISSGTLNEAVVYPRLVVECALRHKANSVILAHNHPSGDVAPSRGDIETTEMVLNALSAIGITLHDHIIVGGGSAYSMVRGEILDCGETREQSERVAEKN